MTRMSILYIEISYGSGTFLGEHEQKIIHQFAQGVSHTPLLAMKSQQKLSTTAKRCK